MMTERNSKRVANLKALRFGAELETVGLSDRAAAEAICGITGGTITTNTTYLGGFIVTTPDGRQWKAIRDGSLHDASGLACEVVSPILTFADLDLLQAITRALRAAGARVNHSCGMHVHVDGAGFKADPAKVRNMIALAFRWEALAINMARVIRSRQGYCKTLGLDMVDRFRSGRIGSIDDVARAWYGQGRTFGSHYDQSRYHWINVHALFDKGTIEFRLFNGTLHAGQVKANVLFALGMASAALNARSISFKGKRVGSRSLPDGRRAITAHDSHMFIVHVLCLVGEEFKNYRKHLTAAIQEVA